MIFFYFCGWGGGGLGEVGGGQGEVGGGGRGGGVSEIFFCAHGREWGMRGGAE